MEIKLSSNKCLCVQKLADFVIVEKKITAPEAKAWQLMCKILFFKQQGSELSVVSCVMADLLDINVSYLCYPCMINASAVYNHAVPRSTYIIYAQARTVVGNNDRERDNTK